MNSSSSASGRQPPGEDEDKASHQGSPHGSESDLLLPGGGISQSHASHHQGIPATMSSPKILPQYMAALCATMGAMAMGTVLGYSSPAGIILTGNATANSSLHLTSQENSWFSSVSNVGGFIGGPVAGMCINYFGRRGTMVLSVMPFAVGWALIAGAQNFAMLILGRIVTGFCCGLICLAVPNYIGEFASPHIRGVLGGGFQLMVVFGILFSYSMGAAFESFRGIAAVCLVIPCVHSALMIFNRESPSFLLSKGRDAEAKNALKYFRGSEYSGLEEELEALNVQLEQSRKNKVSLRHLTTPYIMKPLIMSAFLMIFQQLSGVNAVLFNLGIIFESSGSTMTTTASSMVVGVTQVGATLVGALLTDKAGRKVLLVISTVFMIISLSTLGLFFYLVETDPDLAASLGWLPLTSLVVFIAFFSIGYGPIPWVMMGELFSSEVREVASSIVTMINWFFVFLTTLLFVPLQSVIHDYGIYWLFASICVVNLFFVIFFVFETKGKTLQEITAHFGGPQPLATTNDTERKNTI